MRKLTRILGLLLAFTLLAAACSSDDAEEAVETAEEVVEEEMAEEEMAEEEMAEEEMAEEESLGSIVDVASAAGSFPTLLAAAEAAGLVETLSGDTEFTILAPTEEAFAAALDALGLTAEELLADTETLTAILTYHALIGSVDAATVISLDGTSVPTVNGAEISIAVVDGGVVINDSVNVVTTDIMADNGIIHVIDGVLLPPTE